MLEKIFKINDANEALEDFAAEVDVLKTINLETLAERDELKAALSTREENINTLLKNVETLTEEVEGLQAVVDSVETEAAKIAATVGATEEVEADADDKGGVELWQEYHALTEPAERNAFYQKNRDKLFNN